MNLTEILQSKAFIIAAVVLTVVCLLYYSGAWAVLKRILYDILWNHTSQKFDYNNFAKLLVLCTTLYLLLGTHVQITFNPLLVKYEKPATELFAVLFLYTLGESAFKLWFNRTPQPSDTNVQVKSETAIINQAPAKPTPKADTLLPLDKEVLKGETKPDKG